jgi:hypothetical protein
MFRPGREGAAYWVGPGLGREFAEAVAGVGPFPLHGPLGRGRSVSRGGRGTGRLFSRNCLPNIAI